MTCRTIQDLRQNELGLKTDHRSERTEALTRLVIIGDAIVAVVASLLVTVDELLEVVDAKRGRSGLLNDSEGSVNDGLVDDLELQERLDDVVHCDDTDA